MIIIKVFHWNVLKFEAIKGIEESEIHKKLDILFMLNIKLKRKQGKL